MIAEKNRFGVTFGLLLGFFVFLGALYILYYSISISNSWHFPLFMAIIIVLPSIKAQVKFADDYYGKINLGEVGIGKRDLWGRSLFLNYSEIMKIEKKMSIYSEISKVRVIGKNKKRIVIASYIYANFEDLCNYIEDHIEKGTKVVVTRI